MSKKIQYICLFKILLKLPELIQLKYTNKNNLYLSLENFRPDSLFHMDLVHNYQWSQLT